MSDNDMEARKNLADFSKLIRDDLPQESKNGIKIAEYIKNHEGCNENEVVAAMDKKICSRLTTLKEIDKLLKSGLIEDRKEGNSFHRLYYNDESLVNRINRQLDKLENFIDAGYKPTKKMFEKGWDKSRGKELFEVEFIYPSYTNAIIVMLDTLLVLTYTKIPTHESRRELYARIIALMIKHNSEYIEDAASLLSENAENLIEFRDKVLSRPISTSAAKKNSELLMKLATDMSLEIGDFQREFLEVK